MEHEGTPRPRFTMSLRRYRRIAIITVAGVCFLTVAGAIVRLTGSGLGCDDWPNCNNERFVDVSSGHAAVEQVNRLISGLVGIPTLLMTIGAFRVRPMRRGIRVPSLLLLATILGNGVVGGIAVRNDLHPFLVQSHFLLAMLSILFGLVAIHRARPDEVTPRESIGVTPALSWLFVVLGAFMATALTTGTVVTGAGPHAGDETARRYGFDISTVAEIHSVTVWMSVSVFLVLVVALRRDRNLLHRLSGHVSTWMFIAVVQGGIGYVQYFNDIPATLVAAHVAGATALWLVTVRFTLAALEPLAAHAPDADDVHAMEPAAERQIVFQAAPTV